LLLVSHSCLPAFLNHCITLATTTRTPIAIRNQQMSFSS
jgi:hypothetical protein